MKLCSQSSLSHVLGTSVGSQPAAGKREEAEVKSEVCEIEVYERDRALLVFSSGFLSCFLVSLSKVHDWLCVVVIRG